jgi:hypothetical protein
MQGPTYHMREPAGKGGSTYSSHHPRKHGVSNTYGHHCEVRPGDSANRRSKCVHALRPGQGCLHADATRIREGREGTLTLKGALRTSKIAPTLAEEPDKLIPRTRLQGGSPGAVRNTSRRHHRLLLRQRHSVLLSQVGRSQDPVGNLNLGGPISSECLRGIEVVLGHPCAERLPPEEDLAFPGSLH